jgi:PadR family transcriptional regulator PadR
VNVQYKKGVLELCVLSILSKGDCYGYEVSETISKIVDISESTIYPILRKLKDEGLVTTYLVEESGGPPRKYYKLTGQGGEQFARDKNEWLDFTTIINKFMEV